METSREYLTSRISACAFAALLLVIGAQAIVVRHDVTDARYCIAASDVPALALLPDEGQGVLISPQWVVTAAHATMWRPIHEVMIQGEPHAVSKVIVHPGYKRAPENLRRGDAATLMAFAEHTDDIALLKLESPIAGVAPVALYRGHDETGRIAQIIGRGATGNGKVGQYPNSPHAGKLRRAYERIISAEGRWLGLRFEAPPRALPLEGMPADGDSGAPVFIRAEGRWKLAGIVSHKYATGDLASFKCCLYGQVTYQARISHYLEWIEQTMGQN